MPAQLFASTVHLGLVGVGLVDAALHRHHIVQQILAADVEQVRLHLLVELQAADQPLHATPGGFQLLEGRRMQQGPQLVGGRGIDRRDQAGLLQRDIGHDVRRHDAADEGVNDGRRRRCSGAGHRWPPSRTCGGSESTQTLSDGCTQGTQGTQAIVTNLAMFTPTGASEMIHISELPLTPVDMQSAGCLVYWNKRYGERDPELLGSAFGGGVVGEPDGSGVDGLISEAQSLRAAYPADRDG